MTKYPPEALWFHMGGCGTCSFIEAVSVPEIETDGRLIGKFWCQSCGMLILSYYDRFKPLTPAAKEFLELAEGRK